MVTFNFESYANSQFQLENLGLQFGVPTCIIDMAEDLLAALPAGPVGGLSVLLKEGMVKAKDFQKTLFNDILSSSKFLEYDEATGLWKIGSDWTDSLVGKSLADFADTVGEIASLGYSIYNNVKTTQEQINFITNCLDKFSQSDELARAGTTGATQGEITSMLSRINEAQDFIDKAQKQISTIDKVLVERQKNPSLEPLFNLDSGVVSGTLLEDTLSKIEELEQQRGEPIFDLIFGPPLAKSGQFILSVDGLYYDSQTGGLPEVSGFIAPEDRLSFEYAPNLGGKGELVTVESFDKYTDTVFDLNKIDDSKDIREFYEKDNLLQVLVDQKNKQIYDLSGQLNELLTEPVLSGASYDASDAVIINLKQSIQAVASKYQERINKRKKQIEIAVRMPQLYGGTVHFNPGEIPINDFTYLAAMNVKAELDKQRRLTFRTGEVEDVVLPLRPKFVKATEEGYSFPGSYLLIPQVDSGGIVYAETNQAQASGAFTLGLNDTIETEGLISVFNYLNSEVNTNPGDSKQTVTNHKYSPPIFSDVATRYDLNGKLIAKNQSHVFSRGLAVPKFTGVVEKNPSTGAISSLGSVTILPDQKDYQNLMYGSEGWTIQAWVHMPDIYDPSGWGLSGNLEASSTHRLLMACENTGGQDVNICPNDASLDLGSDYVRGFVTGFTIDSRIRANRTVTNSISPTTGGIVEISSVGPSFYAAMTRSIDGSNVEFIKKTDDCNNSLGVYKFEVPLSSTVDGVGVSGVRDGFMMLTLTYDCKQNKISLYGNKTLLATSSIPDAFGLLDRVPLNVPSFKQTNSFEYSTSSTGTSICANGPKLNKFFTPWVIGGGYTDGISSRGFMGNYHGRDSGLKGYLGSVKLYNRPLSQGSINGMYKAQRGFFENVRRQEPLNYLVILIDDIGVEQLKCYDDMNQYSGDYPYAYTPNIDQMCVQGIRLNQFRTQPTCSLSRAALLSGMYPKDNGCGSNISVLHSGSEFLEYNVSPSPTFSSIPAVMTLSGYNTGAFGKWHLALQPSDGGTFPNHVSDAGGFEYFEVVESNLGSGNDIAPPMAAEGIWAGYYNYIWWTGNTSSNIVSDAGDHHYITEHTVDRALNWINSCTKPWFCYVAFNAIHTPDDWPPSSMHNFSATTGTGILTQPSGEPDISDFANMRMRAIIEALDYQIGRLLDGISDKRSKTVVFLMGDNGTTGNALLPYRSGALYEPRYHPGHPYYQADDEYTPNSSLPYSNYANSRFKTSMWEGGTHCPCLITGPTDIVRVINRNTDALANIADIGPTILDLANISYPSGVNGRTMASIMDYTVSGGQRSWSLNEKFTPNQYQPVSADVTGGNFERSFVYNDGTDIWKIYVDYFNDPVYRFFHIKGPSEVDDPLELTELGASHPKCIIALNYLENEVGYV